MDALKYFLQINSLTGTIFIIFGIIIFLLIFYTIRKFQTIALLKRELMRLSHEVEELDHQANLIIKSDMELKLYQEEIEDKLRKLTLLRNLIISSINILDREELFSELDEELINNLGFKKAALFLYPQEEIIWSINFSPQELETFKKILNKKALLLHGFSVVNSLCLETDEQIKPLLEEIRFKDFLFAPINIGTQIYAIFVIGKCILPSGITEAEKETFSIICMYLGQCLDNIKLFEALYHAGEELESKIKEKTFQLTKSLDEIKEISKLKSEFISSVSHELRTPLTSIKGFSSLLVDEKFGKLPTEAKKRLKKIDENVNKLVDMVNILLDISRIESKRMEIKIAPSNLAKLIKDVGEFLLPQITNKGIELSLELPQTLDVYMDENLIERVFINIINNAIKFTPQGGKITVKCEVKDTHTVVAIKDTGCGVEKNDLEKIFQEFYRVDNPINKDIKGTGLGLSLVNKIIETHGEKIWVESEINKGTCFYFTLKLVK